MQIKLKEVIEAIDETDSEHQYFYYIPEERIIPKEEGIKEKYLIPLPTHKEIDDYGTMRDFIEECTDGEEQEWLREAIRGSGAFRRFRNTLERFGLTDKWLSYQRETHEAIALDWCDYYGVEYLDDKAEYQREENEEEEIVLPKKTVPSKHNYRMIDINEDNVYGLAYLTVDFRKTLSSFKGIAEKPDVDDAVAELKHYLKKGCPIYAISDNGRYVGYAVCRIDDDVVWLESLYVRPEARRKGVGRMLLQRSEALAKEYGNDTLYQYVHPNNDVMLTFLKTNGYDVLNLIEIRKAYPEEEPKSTYQIGDHEYRY